MIDSKAEPLLKEVSDSNFIGLVFAEVVEVISEDEGGIVF